MGVNRFGRVMVKAEGVARAILGSQSGQIADGGGGTSGPGRSRRSGGWASGEIGGGTAGAGMRVTVAHLVSWTRLFGLNREEKERRLRGRRVG